MTYPNSNEGLIERLRKALEKISALKEDRFTSATELACDAREIARAALSIRVIEPSELCPMCQDEGVVEDGEGNERRCPCQEKDSTPAPIDEGVADPNKCPVCGGPTLIANSECSFECRAALTQEPTL